jgi:tetratricopeptide (TPR) repeat protein
VQTNQNFNLEKGIKMDNKDLLTVDTQENGRFFRLLDWSAFWTATIITFIVYLISLAPTVTLEDSGELAVASDYLGVPHPPGYPIWTIITWIFTKIFAFVKYQGQPNPAWSVALASAVFGALAAGITAMLVCRSGFDMLRELRKSSHVSHLTSEKTICWIGGVVASLLFAFTPVMWSQSVIVEVYSLNAFFLVLIFLLTYQWMSRPSDHLLYLTAFIFGLGLTNYQVLLLAALPLVFSIFMRDVKLFRDFLITGAPIGLTVALMKLGYLPPIKHPLDITCFVYLSLNFLVLILASFLLPRGRTVALTIFLVEVGVAFYALMPIVSDLRNPPINWGYPRTWEGFKHAITRGQYEKIKPTDIFTSRFIQQIGAYVTDLRGQFTLPITLLGFLPFTIWTVKVAGRKINAMYVAIALSLFASIMVIIEKGIFHTTSSSMTLAYKLPAALVILILLIGGFAIFTNQLNELVSRLLGKTHATISERITVGAVMLGGAGAFLLYTALLLGKAIDAISQLGNTAIKLSTDQVWALLFQAGGLLVLIVAPVLLVGLIAWLMKSRHEFKLQIDTNSQRWIIATLLGFLTMSILLIALANPKGDIQDNFIQRVKFISSHALYAFWIGYGLIFGLAVAGTIFKNKPFLRNITIITALTLWLIPIQQNASNKELIRTSGGAEQNNHDFGWQFGNYELRGAAAISEELSKDEEPLPNPGYPKGMGPNAVFFGGTDPGRFVPTYMIYSARVREDVYLITQNALADNTYMSVMRDLYGDQIWIPDQNDSARSFQRYVEEVRSGKRPKNAELKIENGRVQVSGALGVMEINGILAQMIFEHNNYKHDFYVEESYVIRWMYPYLSPHGLIMKINNKRANLDPKTVTADLDFWDWYTRRLISDQKFIRDIVARKSFSKLRSAIAGLYANKGMYAQAETAFQQARTLYPLSPEATFRLAQEVMLPHRRVEDARDLLIEFSNRDPGSTKSKGFITHLDNLIALNKRTQELEAKQKEGKIDINTALELIQCYQQSGKRQQFAGLTRKLLTQTNLPPEVFLRIAGLSLQAKQYKEVITALELCENKLGPRTPPNVYLEIAKMYAGAKRADKMLPALEKYLRLNPSDWKAWLDLASVQYSMKKTAAATRAMQEAVRTGGQQAIAIINKDQRLQAIAQHMPRNQMKPNLMNLPGITPRPLK